MGKKTTLSEITADQLEVLRKHAEDGPAAHAIAKLIRGEQLTDRESRAFQRFYRKTLEASEDQTTNGEDVLRCKHLTKLKLYLECWRRATLLGHGSRRIAKDLGLDKSTVCRAVKSVASKLPVQMTHGGAMELLNASLLRIEMLADMAIAEAGKASGPEKAALITAGMNCTAKMVEIMGEVGLIKIVPMRIQTENLHADVTPDAPSAKGGRVVDMAVIGRGLRKIYAAEKILENVTGTGTPPPVDA